MPYSHPIMFSIGTKLVIREIWVVACPKSPPAQAVVLLLFLMLSGVQKAIQARIASHFTLDLYTFKWNIFLGRLWLCIHLQGHYPYQIYSVEIVAHQEIKTDFANKTGLCLVAFTGIFWRKECKYDDSMRRRFNGMVFATIVTGGK